jgi:hypothetical protein
LNSDTGTSGSTARRSKLPKSFQRGGVRISQSVKVRASEATSGPRVKRRNPSSHGSIAR